MKSVLCGTVISVENKCTEPMSGNAGHIHCSKALKEHFEKTSDLSVGSKKSC